MIEQLLVFKQSGILLLKKEIETTLNKEPDELVSGFLSVLFQYFTERFGKIEKIQTSENLILITKIGKIYIVLIALWLKEESKLPINGNVYFLNKRLEEIAVNAMRIITKKVNRYYSLHPSELDKICYDSFHLSELESLIDHILETEKQKMNILRNLSNSGDLRSDFCRIYQNN